MTDHLSVPFGLQRIATIMEADLSNPDEIGGVLNPACCRSRDGTLYLYPRVVAAGNWSRIGIARVTYAGAEPVGVERMGYVFEPSEGFEYNERTAGVEDPRVVYVAALNQYVMTYVAYGPRGPRVALAVSNDALQWRRVGPAMFSYEPRYQTDFNLYDNKDAALFPAPVRAPDGCWSLAMLHRPDYSVGTWTGTSLAIQPAGVTEPRPGIWISYTPLDKVLESVAHLQVWQQHQLLAVPEQPWEALKIGGGTPPVRTSLGWLAIFHGVSGEIVSGVDHQPKVRYCAGVLVLDLDDPRTVLYRSPTPILAPGTAEEQQGIVNNVVFPTGADVRGPDRIDVYYGMADARIGVARMHLPAELPGVIPEARPPVQPPDVLR
jgi:predicted GH43/DUF377 family glycosyl hydrolase